VKKISFTLDTVDNAIKEVKTYKKEFLEKVDRFVKALTERGEEIAVTQIIALDAVYTGELASSIESIMYVEQHKGVIFTNCPWAAFVEFGTGVVGADSPHPTKPWAYDINNHGDKGWVYFDETAGQFRWTAGMPSRPFMYNTLQDLAKEAVTIAKGVFS